MAKLALSMWHLIPYKPRFRSTLNCWNFGKENANGSVNEVQHLRSFNNPENDVNAIRESDCFSTDGILICDLANPYQDVFIDRDLKAF